MAGLPTEEQRLNEQGLYTTEEMCLKCKSFLKYYDGGDQGGMPLTLCIDCGYIREE